VTTTQGAQHWTTIQAPPRWYALSLQLHYKASSKQGPLYGYGQTSMMSSQGIIFASGDGLKPGMNAEIVVAWPFLLDGHIRLQLVLETIVTGSQDGVAEARILAHHFRTRPTGERGQPAEQAGWNGPAGDHYRVQHPGPHPGTSVRGK
jgi:hypothetical protein